MKDDAMQSSDEQPKADAPFDPLKDPKSTAPAEMPGMSPGDAARLGIWSDGGAPGIRRRYPYSKM